MAANKDQSHSRLSGVLEKFTPSRFFGLFLVVAMFVTPFVVWRVWKSRVQPAEQFLAELQIVTTPQPPWIRSDVRAEVYRDGGLNQVSLLDPRATVAIANAFSVHSWVRDVQRVSKSAEQVRVELQYRRPVAMVEVRDSQNQAGLLPVDIDSVVLPTGDFLSLPEDELRCYLRIVAGYTLPAGPIGTKWGDEKIQAGARIAVELDSVWRSLGLYRLTTTTPSGSEPEFELSTAGKRRLIWGRQPGREAIGEAKAADKLKRLKELASSGPLDQIPDYQEIDLRGGHRVAEEAAPALR